MTGRLRLKLLGTPVLESLDRSVGGASALRQPLALLAVLASSERGVARDKLLALFWPEAPVERASHRLSQLLHSTRRMLGSPALIGGTADLRLESKILACDLWEFASAIGDGRLEAAEALYGGPFLDGFFLERTPEFDRWVEGRRSALARQYQDTLEALAVQAEVRGDSLAAAGWWQRLAEHEPLSSRVTMHLMTALAASGERARALQQALAYEQQMRAELQADPNPAVLALARLLKHDPGAGRAVAASVTPAIAVLPVVALAADGATRALAAGLTEELLTAAAACAGVRVLARATLEAIRETTPDLRELGARLGLAAVLESSVRATGGRARITARLIDVTDGCQRWTGRYEQALGDGFVTEDALARRVMEDVTRALSRPPDGPGRLP